MEPKQQTTHHWVRGSTLSFNPQSRLYHAMVCKNCGVIRGNTETPCRGRVKVTLR